MEKKEVQEDLEAFGVFKFEKKAFPKKSSFKEWVESNKFNHADVIKQV